MSLRVAFTEKPEMASMSRIPLKYSVSLPINFNDSTQAKIRAGVYMESLAWERDFKLVYEEERTTPADFDISSVVDSELSFEIPPQNLSDSYFARQVAKQYFLATRDRDVGEYGYYRHWHLAGYENAYLPLPSGGSLQPNHTYRISAAYVEGYEQESFTLLDAYEINPPREFFNGNEYLHDGKIQEIIHVNEEFPLSKVKLPYPGQPNSSNGWWIEVWELPFSSTVKWAIKGRRWWPDTDPSNPPSFLTEMPKERSFIMGQEAWLWFRIQDVAPARSFDFECHYADGSMLSGSKQFSTSGCQPGQAWAFPISDMAMGYSMLDPQKRIERIVVRAMGEEVILNNTLEGLPYLREFHFNNRIGGTDWLITFGKSQKSEDFEYEEYRQFSNIGGRAFSKTHIADRSKFSVSIGYRSKSERDAAAGLLRSELAYTREEGRMLPINVISKSLSYEKDGDRRYTLSFEYTYAFEN